MEMVKRNLYNHLESINTRGIDNKDKALDTSFSNQNKYYLFLIIYLFILFTFLPMQMRYDNYICINILLW